MIMRNDVANCRVNTMDTTLQLTRRLTMLRSSAQITRHPGKRAFEATSAKSPCFQKPRARRILLCAGQDVNGKIGSLSARRPSAKVLFFVAFDGLVNPDSQ